MNRTLIKLAALAFTALLIVGCSQQWSVFDFHNQGTETVWVDHVGPLSASPPCGFLIPGGNKTANIAPLTIPQKLTITWWVRPKGDNVDDPTPIKTEIEISNYSTVSHKNDLIISYTDSGWSAHFKP